MFDGTGGPPPEVNLVLYTDAFIIRGSILTRQRRITDILNMADDRFLVLGGVTSDEFGSRGETIRAEYAQVNLASVLFAVADTTVETPPEMRMPKTPAQALISVPPFKVTGDIHVMQGHDLRAALTELTGKFLPVTDAAYWSDVLGEARQTAAIVAVNHERAQILAPHTLVDPWAGLGPSTAVDSATDGDDVTTGAAPEPPPWPATDVPPPSEPTGW
jgi:hypothetical protein